MEQEDLQTMLAIFKETSPPNVPDQIASSLSELRSNSYNQIPQGFNGAKEDLQTMLVVPTIDANKPTANKLII